MNWKSLVVLAASLPLVSMTAHAASTIYIVNGSSQHIAVMVKNRGTITGDVYLPPGTKMYPLTSSGLPGHRAVVVSLATRGGGLALPTQVLALGTYDPTFAVGSDLYVIYYPQPGNTDVCDQFIFTTGGPGNYKLLGNNKVPDSDKKVPDEVLKILNDVKPIDEEIKSGF